MKRALGVGMVATFAACSFPKPADVVGDDDPPMDALSDGDGTADMGPDAPRPDAPANFACVGTGGLFEFCYDRAMPPIDRMLVGGLLDTDTDPRCDPGYSNVCVVIGNDVMVPATVTIAANGSRPLIIVATGNLEIQGELDLLSLLGGTPAAGANPGACMPPMMPQGSGGGAGGSFGHPGGTGGPRQGALPAQPGPASPSPHAMIRGGCPGGTGLGSGGEREGGGGNGGGAVHLLAGTELKVLGLVHAGGAGGDSCGSFPNCGGGGGGSGGFIGLDAPVISIQGGRLIATGGAGAEGTGLAGNGNVGENSPASGAAARGGAGGSSTSGDGGDGGATMAGTNGLNGSNQAGGGGGGGGAGAIATRGTVSLMGAAIARPAPVGI